MMVSRATSELEIGQLGERLVAAYLERCGATLLDHNYVKPCGELDLVVSYHNNLHVVEVKTKTVPSCASVNASAPDPYRPEVHVTPAKIARLQNTVACWQQEFRWHGAAQIDVIAVYVSLSDQDASLEWFPAVC
jgi:Holliday junction resolvase-like predicted endonuclease